MRIALDFVVTYVLPVPRTMKGVFKSIIRHINSRKEKRRSRQLERLPFRRTRFTG